MYTYTTSHPMPSHAVPVCTMLLGLQALAQVTSDESSKEWVHRAIYTMSCIVGLIGMTYTLYNIYGLTYKKRKGQGSG